MGLDHTWESVKNFQQKVMRAPKDEDDQLYFREWDAGALERIVHQQSAIVSHQKQLGMKQLYQICIVLETTRTTQRCAIAEPCRCCS